MSVLGCVGAGSKGPRASLNSSGPRLPARGIFRGHSFVGDYTYSRCLMLDRGQWIFAERASVFSPHLLGCSFWH